MLSNIFIVYNIHTKGIRTNRNGSIKSILDRAHHLLLDTSLYSLDGDDYVKILTDIITKISDNLI